MKTQTQPETVAEPKTPSLGWAVLLALIQQALVFGVTTSLLDGGWRTSICQRAVVAFWIVVILLRLRRKPLTIFETAFIRIGTIPACVLSYCLDGLF
jgi:hypothetical protein